MTGTGNTFIEEISPETLSERLPKSKITPTVWDHIYSDAKRLIMNPLDIEVPHRRGERPGQHPRRTGRFERHRAGVRERRLPGRPALPEWACSCRRGACDLAVSARTKSRPLFSSYRRATLSAGSPSIGGCGGSRTGPRSLVMAPRRCVTPSPARSSRCPNSCAGR
jgi:hypothetical protein